MRTMKQLIAILNECCHAYGNRVTFDAQAFEHRVPSKRERAAVMKAIESTPPTLLPYRGRFCFIEYATAALKDIALVIDHDGKAVLVTSGGKVVWEEHNPA